MGFHRGRECRGAQGPARGSLAEWTVQEISEYDRPLLREVVSGAREGIPEGAIYPLEERWALVWEHVEEDPETSRRVRENPTNWASMPVDRL